MILAEHAMRCNAPAAVCVAALKWNDTYFGAVWRACPEAREGSGRSAPRGGLGRRKGPSRSERWRGFPWAAENDVAMIERAGDILL